MKKKIPLMPVLFALALAGLVVSGISCHLLLPLSSYTSQSTYKCTAQFYRSVGTGQEFTENWQAWIWPYDKNDDGTVNSADAALVCQEKADNYKNQIMAPGFTWQYRNLNAAIDPKPLAVPCPPDQPIYGGPVGNDMSVWYPDASFEINYKDSDGNIRSTSATAKNANFVFAERTGLPNGVIDTDSVTGYDTDLRHIRISDLRIEFNDFSTVDIDAVKGLYIQSIGTIFADNQGGGTYRLHALKGKFYVEAVLEKDGDSEKTNQCFENSTWAEITEVDYGTPMLTFSFQKLGALEGFPDVQYIRVHFGSGGLDPFQQHQPYVYLKDKQWTSTSGVLTFTTDDFITDEDNDITPSKVLWFENFEQAGSEVFLGNSFFLPVTLGWGQHKITVVVYDQRGAYTTSTMNVTVQTMPGDLDSDGQVCSTDVQIIFSAKGQKASGPDDPRDLDKDGWITVADAAKAVSLCTHVNCACE